jgi:metal-responsive CopG/Arc/MetJ family transcriptional regulator
MDQIMAMFSTCLKNGNEANSVEVQELVRKLQNHISENYYYCTNEILASLGGMYVADERFKNNIDKHAIGTAEYISKAINFYCKK